MIEEVETSALADREIGVPQLQKTCLKFD